MQFGRATAITTALSNTADIKKTQDWLGHANVPTIRLCDRRNAVRAQRYVSCEVSSAVRIDP